VNQIAIAIAAVVAASGAAPTQAQKPVTVAAPPSPITRAQFLNQLNSGFAAIDTNHDGSLSLAEIQAGQQRDLAKVQAAARAKLEAQFRQLDTNHDGQLSLAEFQAIASVRANSTPQQILQQFDANHDGKVSAAEFNAPRLRQFDAADTNHDGVVSPAEAAAAAKK
jgi:Ca2+-binding EF-hand superfamily protein